MLTCEKHKIRMVCKELPDHPGKTTYECPECQKEFRDQFPLLKGRMDQLLVRYKDACKGGSGEGKS